MTNIIDGKVISQKIKKELTDLCKKITPSLQVCLVGNNSASEIYVKNKQKICAEVGITCNICHLPSDISQKMLLKYIENWNDDDAIDGIIVQLPLPKHIDQNLTINKVNPHKDVDCFHYSNIGRLVQGQPRFLPCTPMAVAYLLQHAKVPLVGKRVCIVNDSIVVGLPLATILTKMGATVTVCNEYTENIEQIARSSSVVVTAVGHRPDFVLTPKYVQEGATVIDVGINRKDDGKIVGDADFESLLGIVANITKVPGFGSMTVCMLMQNTIQAHYISRVNI